MGGQPVEIGPWPGGINLLEDERLISDQQLVTCDNFNIGRQGELMLRTGIKKIALNAGASKSIAMVQLPTGYSRFYTRVTTASPNSIYYTDTGSVFTSLGNTNADQVSAIVEHVGVVNTADALIPYAWFIPRGASTLGLRQRLDTGVVSTLGTTNTYPRGSGAIMFKERLFIYGSQTEGGSGTYRVYYSAVGDFTSFPANNYFDVNPGDGDFVSAIAIQSDSLIIFKTTSTWALYFDTDPGLGTLRRINSEIGATGPNAVATYQNEIYLISRTSVYRMVNLLFENIGQNLNLPAGRGPISTNLDTISPVHDRIIFKIWMNTAFQYFVYNYNVQAWSTYSFTNTYAPDRLLHFVNTVINERYLGVVDGGTALLDYRPGDIATSSNYGDSDSGSVNQRVTQGKIVTKRYSWGSPSHFKRLFWWALEINANGAGWVFNTSMTSEGISGAGAMAITTILGRALIKFASVARRFRYIQFTIDTLTGNAVYSTLPGLSLTVFGGEVNISENAKERLNVNA